MGELFMIAGIVTAIILCFVGVIKLPFAKFKAQKPKLYKATFTLLSIILSVVVCGIIQVYLLADGIFTTNFAVLLSATIAGVFGLYSSYEGLGLKNLVKIMLAKIQELANKAPESKLAKYIDKVGIDKAIEIIEDKKQSEKVEAVQAPAETQNQAPTSEV